MLGWSLRVATSSLPELWPVERRRTYLLDQSIARPLSADPSVWPLIDAPSLSAMLFGPPHENNAQNGLGLGYLRPGFEWAPIGDAVLVGLQAPSPVEQMLKARHGIGQEAREQQSIASRTELLGYDVCDQWLCSGLTNCGLADTPREHERLRGEFSPRLNRHGLFDDEEIAGQFAAAISRLVAEHAPFYVMALRTLGGTLA